jgi:ankyrin repeat protein
VVDVLLKAGADPNVHSTNGFSAYVWARLYQSERIMKLLKDAGANTSEGSYWWRNDREARLAWIEQSLKRLCKNGRCQRWAQEEKLRRQRGESRD